MGVMNQAIQDGVRQGRITGGQGRMPGLDWQLADHQGRADLAAIIDHLEQVLGLDHVGWREEKIVQDENADSGELA